MTVGWNKLFLGFVHHNSKHYEAQEVESIISSTISASEYLQDCLTPQKQELIQPIWKKEEKIPSQYSLEWLVQVTKDNAVDFAKKM